MIFCQNQEAPDSCLDDGCSDAASVLQLSSDQSPCEWVLAVKGPGLGCWNIFWYFVRGWMLQSGQTLPMYIYIYIYIYIYNIVIVYISW